MTLKFTRPSALPRSDSGIETAMVSPTMLSGATPEGT